MFITQSLPAQSLSRCGYVLVRATERRAEVNGAHAENERVSRTIIKLGGMLRHIKEL